MKKATKIFLSVVLVLIVLIIVGAVVAVINLDRIVKKSVEVYGPQITKVSVNLDSVHIGLLTGSADIKGLVVGNPPAYKTPHAISVGEISVGVDPLSLTKDKIIIRSIKVISPEITFEGGMGGNNLLTIKDNIGGTPKQGNANVVTNSAGQPEKSKSFEVDDLLITGAKVSGTVDVFGKTIPAPNLPLPDIHITNLGKGPKGITGADLTERIFDAIEKASVKKLGDYAANLGSGAVNLGSTNISRIKKGISNLFH